MRFVHERMAVFVIALSRVLISPGDLSFCLLCDGLCFILVDFRQRYVLECLIVDGLLLDLGKVYCSLKHFLQPLIGYVHILSFVKRP